MVQIPAFQVGDLADMSDARLRALLDDLDAAGYVIGGVLAERARYRPPAEQGQPMVGGECKGCGGAVSLPGQPRVIACAYCDTPIRLYEDAPYFPGPQVAVQSASGVPAT
jgi:hypothetical protein